MINEAKTTPITQKERLKSSDITVLFVKVKIYPIEETERELDEGSANQSSGSPTTSCGQSLSPSFLGHRSWGRGRTRSFIITPKPTFTSSQPIPEYLLVNHLLNFNLAIMPGNKLFPCRSVQNLLISGAGFQPRDL